jgi:predicted metalloprotease
MRWKEARRSRNVEDRRGRPVRGGLAIGGGGAVLVLLLALALGVDPMQLLGGMETGPVAAAPSPAPAAADDELALFVQHVLGDTETAWGVLLPEQAGRAYAEPRLVLFRDRVQSACGIQGAATGPFYCPGDSQVYIDLGFYETLRQELGANGDFAQAYVIAHEVGHHVQNLLGTSEEVHRAQRGLSDEDANELSVRLELQADFYAGVWAHEAAERGLLEPGDVEEALNAAAAIGDDRLMRHAGQAVAPESFTHGTSAQRVRWFELGMRTGDLRQGDTFAAGEL